MRQLGLDELYAEAAIEAQVLQAMATGWTKLQLAFGVHTEICLWGVAPGDKGNRGPLTMVPTWD